MFNMFIAGSFFTWAIVDLITGYPLKALADFVIVILCVLLALELLRKIVAWPIVWSLYYAGDLVSRVMHKDNLPQNVVDVLYSFYNRVMWWSSDVQHWAVLEKPWERFESFGRVCSDSCNGFIVKPKENKCNE